MVFDTTPAADRLVRETVAIADRRRRMRQASVRLWRAAPLVTAPIPVGAAVARWAGWSAAVPLGVLAAAVLGLAAFAWFCRRPRPITDAVAAAVDADAGLNGELRSANWFATLERRDGWTDLHQLHVGRAAERLTKVDWDRLYPPIRAPRARLATSLMVIATVAIAIAFPGRARGIASEATARANPRAINAKPADAPSELLLPPELQKELEALLAAAEAGTLAVDKNGVPSGDLRDLLARLKELRDRDALRELARGTHARAGSERAAQDMKSLADRARHAAEMGAVSREFRETMEELARKLTDAANAEKADAEDAAAAVSSETPQPSDAGQTNAASSMDEASVQSVKDAEAGGASGVMMMSGQDAPAGDAPPGFGIGGSGAMNTAAGMAAIEAALRQETVEASKDTQGENVTAQVRRKTEQGHATVTFTHSAAGPSERNRAAAPPVVPETRRTDVQRYFVRKQ